MARGIFFCLMVWMFVSAAIAIYSQLSSTERLSVKRILIYGFLTAIVAGGLVGTIVTVF
jgi:hypothetical protein